jgi:hypothetical protein
LFGSLVRSAHPFVLPQSVLPAKMHTHEWLLQMVPGSAQSELSTHTNGVGVGVAAPTTHELATQPVPLGQTLPQRPQLFGSLVRSAHPFVLPQSVRPVKMHEHEWLLQIVPGSGQSELSMHRKGVGVGVAAPTTHELARQPVPLGQTLPQRPQLFGSPVMSTHPVVLPQSVRPVKMHAHE